MILDYYQLGHVRVLISFISDIMCCADDIILPQQPISAALDLGGRGRKGRQLGQPRPSAPATSTWIWLPPP